jgi:exosortase
MRLDAVLLLAVLAVFAPALVSFSAVWDAVDYQAHGYLVGPVAAAMAWSRRSALGERRPEPWGLALLILALAAYGAGLLAGLLALQGIALPLALAGLVLYRRGARALGSLASPIAYLVFLVPVPPQLLSPIVTQLQSFVTAAAITVLHVAGVPVLREGNVIVVPEGSLFVAEACSGITSIVTLLPVAALLAFLTPGPLRRAVALLLAVIPVAMFWNLVRVLLTVGATRWVGAERATTGWLHDSAGMLTFVMGCLTLLALSAIAPDRSHALESPRGQPRE